MLSTNFGSYELKISISIAGFSLFYGCNNVRAQIVGDRLTNTQVKVENNISHIVGGTQAGNNLFHSFKQFSVNADTTANFEHGLNIDNIFGRVTGGNISEIDGSIQTQGEANLFLINPAGIIFGANARLDVGGSFVATTAERVIFEDGTKFSAVTADDRPILTISSPIGLQYGTAGAITLMPNANRGTTNNENAGLKIQPGNTLALLGGDVSITRNSLNATASNIEIGSIKSGTVSLESSERGWDFNYDNVFEYGKINVSNRAFINSSGIVNFQAKTIDFASGSGISNFTDVTGEGSTIEINATESVSLDSSFLFNQVGQTSLDLKAIADVGGEILIKAPKIFLTNGSVVSAGTLSEGAGGNITLEGSQTIELSSAIENRPSIISTSTSGIGEGGDININARRLKINDGSQIQAFAGEGKGGTITARATESIDISGTGILPTQDGTGNTTKTILSSGFTASSGFEGLPFEHQPQGESGNLIISTPELTIADLGHISVSNYGLSNAGDIKITTNNLRLDTVGKITANTTASLEGGSISVVAQDLIVLDRQSTISTSAQQNGNGGNISLKADNLVLLEQNTIKANALQGSGGNISIDTQGYFIDSDSKITASSLIKTKEGTVKIVNLDLDSRLHMSQKEYTPLVAQDYISTGCGSKKDFAQNHLRNVGRGGIPMNPIKEITNLDVLDDLGENKGDRVISSVLTKDAPLMVKTNAGFPLGAKQNELDNDKQSVIRYETISEANSWKTNSQGKIELIARDNFSAVTNSSACQINKQ